MLATEVTVATTKTTERVKALAADRYWGEAEAREAIAALDASGLSRAAFAREYGISAQRLRWWTARLGNAPARGAAIEFLPVHVVGPGPRAASSADAVMEIAIGEVRVRVGAGFDAVALKRLLAVVAEPAC